MPDKLKLKDDFFSSYLTVAPLPLAIERTWECEIGRPVLITKRMTTYYDWSCPAWHQPGHILAYDRLAKHCTTQDITDGSVRRTPHLLQIEFFDALIVGRNRCALYTDAKFLDRIRGINGDLIIGFITFLNAQIIVFEIHF